MMLSSNSRSSHLHLRFHILLVLVLLPSLLTLCISLQSMTATGTATSTTTSSSKTSNNFNFVAANSDFVYQQVTSVKADDDADINIDMDVDGYEQGEGSGGSGNSGGSDSLFEEEEDLEEEDEDGDTIKIGNEFVDEDDSDSDSDSESQSGGVSLENRALVLVHQGKDEEFVAVGKNLTVKFTAVNIGKLPAKDVKITMPNWPSRRFNLLEGKTSGSQNTLAPDERFSFSFTVVPKEIFTLEPVFSQAKVEYRYGDSDPPKEVIGTAGSMGTVEVLPIEKYNRATANFNRYLLHFSLLGGATWLIPGVMYFHYQRQFDQKLETLKKHA